MDPPPKTSPESLRSTRRGLAAGEPDGTFMQTSEVMVRGWPRPPWGRGHPADWSGADAEPGEAGHGAAGTLDDLADGRLRVTGIGLLQEHGLLEEAVHAARDSLRQGGLGLALVARGLLGDTALALHDVRRHVLTGEVLRAVGRDVHRDVAGDLGAGGVGGHEDPDLRRQVLGGAVQVAGHLLTGHAGDAAQDELLAQRGGVLVDQGADGGVAARGGREGLDVGRLGLDGGREDLRGEGDEGLVLRDEVRLGVQLDHHAGLAVAVGHDLDGHEAVGGRTALTLRDALEALDADDLDGLLGVAVGLVERLLDVHHARAGLLAACLDVSGGVVRQGCVSLQSWSVAQAWLAGGSSACGASVAGALSAVCVSSGASPLTTGADSSPVSAASATSWASWVAPATCWAASTAPSVCSAPTGVVWSLCWPSCASRSSRSHSASGSASVAAAPVEPPWRVTRPSATASATTRVRRLTARIASSLPGMP